MLRLRYPWASEGSTETLDELWSVAVDAVVAVVLGRWTLSPGHIFAPHTSTSMNERGKKGSRTEKYCNNCINCNRAPPQRRLALSDSNASAPRQPRIAGNWHPWTRRYSCPSAPGAALRPAWPLAPPDGGRGTPPVTGPFTPRPPSPAVVPLPRRFVYCQVHFVTCAQRTAVQIIVHHHERNFHVSNVYRVAVYS
jgi:hypothetical protein